MAAPRSSFQLASSAALHGRWEVSCSSGPHSMTCLIPVEKYKSWIPGHILARPNPMPSPEIVPVAVQHAFEIPDKVGDMKHFNETFYGKVLLVAKCESHQCKDK